MIVIFKIMIRCVEMKQGPVIKGYQDLQTHLNLKSDFTGGLKKISNTTSSGT